MPSYTTIKGNHTTAQNLADFDAAVNAVGGASVCVGGQSGNGDAITQAVNADIAAAAVEEICNNCPSVTIPSHADKRLHKPRKAKKPKK